MTADNSSKHYTRQFSFLSHSLPNYCSNLNLYNPSVKPLLSLLKSVIEGWKEQRSSPALPGKSFEALKVLTWSQGQRVSGGQVAAGLSLLDCTGKDTAEYKTNALVTPWQY